MAPLRAIQKVRAGLPLALETLVAVFIENLLWPVVVYYATGLKNELLGLDPQKEQ